MGSREGTSVKRAWIVVRGWWLGNAVCMAAGALGLTTAGALAVGESASAEVWQPAGGAARDGGCGAIVMFDQGIEPTRILHVSTSGDDRAGDGTRERPLATIQAAAKFATPGMAIRLGPGVHRGGVLVEALRGRSDAPIWIGGERGGGAIIEGGGEAMHLSRAAYVVVHDLEVRGTANNGINSDDGGRYDDAQAACVQVFRRLKIHDVGSDGNQDGLKLSGVRGFVVDGCEFSRCGGRGSGSGVDMVGCHDGVIARSKFTDLSANGVQAKGGTADVLVTRCRMERAGERSINIGGSTGPEFFRPPLSRDVANAEARRIRVIANVFVGSEAPIAFVGATDCVVAHNTIVDPQRWVVRILQESVTKGGVDFEACGRNRFEANLVSFRRGSIHAGVNVGANVDVASFVFGRNLWFASDGAQGSRLALPVNENGGVVGADPKFRDAAAGDYSICKHSGAAGKGGKSDAGAADFAGACFRSEAAIGAFEIDDTKACACGRE